jgi:hypothetical protein
LSWEVREDGEMTRKQAIKTLIVYAAKWGSGCGVGIRETLKQSDREEIRQAIERMWKEVTGKPIYENDLFNLGL